MSTYFPLHVHSDNSLLDGLSKPTDIAKRCIEADLPGSAITDHGNISGAVSFINAMTKRDKKPIVGCEMYICDGDPTNKENRKLDHLVVLAKNKQGWLQLIKATSFANDPKHFYYKPRIDIESLAKFADGNLIAFSGHLGSTLSKCVFQSFAIHGCKTRAEIKKLTHPDWVERGTREALRLQGIFGKGNFFIEIQLIDSKNVPAMGMLAEALRYISNKTGIPCIATPDAHYAKQEDAFDQRVLLCNSLNTNFEQIDNKIVAGEDVALGSFFRGRNYHIPSYDEMIAFGNTEEELARTLEIADMCEVYKLTAPPMLPQFDCPDGLSSKDYMYKLLREGWTKRLPKMKEVMKKMGWDEQKYVDRLQTEYGTLADIGLADYFLIVHDIIKWAREDGQLTGAGRGSAAGSLLLYLLEVTHIDPLEYDLLFERFYNNSRNIPDYVSFEEKPFLKTIGV